jgi:chorismate mutase
MQKLDQLRAEIEKMDAEIIKKIAARSSIVKQIGQTKKEAGIAVLDPARETQLLQQYQSLAQKNQLDPIFIQHLFEMIFSYSRNLQ